jgi:preprotein translocase subunit YajC
VNYLPLLILAVVLIAAFTMTRRNRQRAAQRQAELHDKITFGTEVMTTSGLYGTVVGRNEDDSVQLVIAPGVEVKWATAALRDISSLPASYRPTSSPPTDPPPDSSGS